MAKGDRVYTISELAREFAVTPRALRFYEDKGLLAPRRDGLNRVYSGRDRARLKLILQGKRVGLPLAEIREVLDLYDVGDGQRSQLAATLAKFKRRIAELCAQRDDIEGALSQLNDGVAWIERRLKENPAAPGAAAATRAFEREARRRMEDAS
jgi:DNA-binding transcriptional MerR regulator